MREPLTTADSRADVTTANATTPDVLGSGLGARVWVRVWFRARVANTTASLGQYFCSHS